MPPFDFGGEGAVAASPLTGRPARTDSLDEQRTGTLLRAERALDAGDFAAAAALLRFARDGECAFIRGLMVEWRGKLHALLLEEGVSEAEIVHEDERLRAALAPDGGVYEAERAWAELLEGFARVVTAVEAAQTALARARLRELAGRWRAVHDREIDLAYGMMSHFCAVAGEEAVPRMFERIGAHHLEEFFALADPARRPWHAGGFDAIVLDTIEAMRAHLSSRERDGRPFEMIETEDGVVMRFDPCGSGGRAVRGDTVEGTGSRLEEPFGLRVVEGAYDWTDGKAGLCVYCTHCLLIYEQATIDRAGWPFIVVEPPAPSTPADERRCQYTIYRRPEDVPTEVYERCGRTKPERYEPA